MELNVSESNSNNSNKRDIDWTSPRGVCPVGVFGAECGICKMCVIVG